MLPVEALPAAWEITEIVTVEGYQEVPHDIFSCTAEPYYERDSALAGHDIYS